MISLISVDEIKEGSSKSIEHQNFYLFAVKKNDQVYLYRNQCPHLGTPLEWEEDKFLDDDNELIRCSTHGALFSIDEGLCLVGPCKGKKIQKIPFVIIRGRVSVEEKYLMLRERF
jgi:nitrite reductase/ring-hydroxylating ferredoxin subunit